MPENETGADPEERTGEADEPCARPLEESAAFARCASCAHAAELDLNGGTLVCKKHSMRCNAETGVIPDDCLQYEAGA